MPVLLSTFWESAQDIKRYLRFTIKVVITISR